MQSHSTVRPTIEDGDQLRAHLRDMWGGVAGAWDRHAEFVDLRGEQITARMLELAPPQPGDHVLELACGPASVGLAAAERVGPDGLVVVSDVAEQMTAIAERRAAALELANVRARVLDLEQIAQPDGSYDVVFCREGLMLVPDPERAAREIRRVLRPGGRLALSVWGPRSRNPWLGIVFDVVGERLGASVPPPGIPHPFSLDDPDRLARLLADAGLEDVVVGELATPYRAASFEEWWQRSSELAGPLAQRLAGLPEQATRALHARAREQASVHTTADGRLDIPGVSLIASARRGAA
jgi:SAM-dependent methyltransferase